jgi:hypothetical protein
MFYEVEMSISKIIVLAVVGALLVLFTGCIQVSDNDWQGQPVQPAQCVEHCTTARQATGNIIQERITCTCGGRTCITDRQKVGSSIDQERTVCYGEV